MANVTFNSFDLVNNPDTGSFLVGYKEDGSAEQRVPVGFFANTGEVVTGPSSTSSAGNVAYFSDTSGKTIAESAVSYTRLAAIDEWITDRDGTVHLKSTWDASAGSFPAAVGVPYQDGASFRVTTGGTVDGIVFAVGDILTAITTNPSTTTYAGNWTRIVGSRYVHPNHSGDVTSTGDGATTITNSAVTNAKMANMTQSTIKGRASGAGNGAPTDLTATQVRTIINVEDGANNYALPVAEVATIGGIKRNEGGSSLFVTGVASDGSLLYGSPAGAGTVTSVAVSGSDGIEIDSGSPITNNGTIFLGVNASNLRNHLDVESGANNYVLPVAETSVIGGIKRNTGGSALFVTGVSSDGDLLYGTTSTSNSLEGNIAIPFVFYTGSMLDTASGQFSANTSDVSTLTEFRISAFPTGGSIDLDYLTGIRSGDYLLINSPNKAFAAKITFAGVDEIPNTVLYGVSEKLGTVDFSNGEVSYLQFDRSAGATYSHPNHTGDVTSVGDGATTIANNAVTFAKFQQISSTTLVGRHEGGSGNTQEVSVGNGLEFSGSGIRRSALTGDVTATAGSNTTVIADSAVTNAKMANMAQATIKGRASAAGTGVPTDLTATQVRAIINVANGAEVNPDLISQAEAEAGTVTTERVISAERLRQAVRALGAQITVQPYTSGVQQLTTTYADVAGSSINYTPKFSSSIIRIVFNFQVGPGDSQGNASFRFYVAGVEATDWKSSVRLPTDDGRVSLEAAYTNTDTSAKIFKWQAREFGASNEVKLHETSLFDGAVSSQSSAAVLTIIEIPT